MSAAQTPSPSPWVTVRPNTEWPVIVGQTSMSPSGRQERETGVGERHRSPLLASLAMAQGESELERERVSERERETAPSTSPLTYISSVIFSTLPFFLHLLFLLYQQLYNCDVMTKAGVMEAQAGRVKTGRRRQKNGMKERGGDSQRLKR